MSFILDALRKSESDRRRTATPMLAGVPVQVARPTIPGWTWAIIGVLVSAIVILAIAWWLSLREAPVAAASVTPASAPGRAQANSSIPAGDPVAAPGIAPAVTAADSNPPAPAGDRPLLALPPLPTPADASTASASATRVGNAPGAAAGGFERGTGAAAATAGATSPASPRTRADALPTFDELRGRGIDLPNLSLELHVYHADPASRWVYLSGGRYTEGRRTAAGPTLVEILPEGVVLDHNGRQFLLTPQ